MDPLEWMGYLPAAVTRLVDPALAIEVFAVYELALGAWLISGKFLRLGAGMAALTLAGNLGQLMVTFRDIGLISAVLPW